MDCCLGSLVAVGLFLPSWVIVVDNCKHYTVRVIKKRYSGGALIEVETKLLWQKQQFGMTIA